jgi:hypothetical protein
MRRADFSQEGTPMKTRLRTLGLLGLGFCLTGMVSSVSAAEPGKTRLFILSGQSNMTGLNPDVSFTPALKKAYPSDELIVVKSAQGGHPIRRWYRDWKPPEGVAAPKPAGTKPGDLYDQLMEKVRAAIKGKTIDTVCFVWMQGERDAREGLSAVYADSVRGLVKQLQDDLKRPDLVVVIGRLSDCQKGQAHWDAVRSAQEKVGADNTRFGWVDTDDLNGEKNDLHYTKAGYEELGRRFAAKATELLAKQAGQSPKPSQP